MKKLFKALAILLAIFMLVSCSSETKKDDSTGADKQVVEIGVAIYKFDDNFMTLYREELAKYFKELGEKNNVEYKLDIQDGKGDQPTQTEQINNFIAQGKKLLILNLVDPTGANSIITKCKEANIPVVLINREASTDDMKLWPGKTTYVGADATQSGTFQGEMIFETANKGDINGDGVVNYIMLQGDPQNVDAQQRTEYSVKALVDAGVKVKALAEPYQGNWESAKGQEFTATALAQFGNDLEVVFANNDAMAMGALTSVQASGRTVGKDIYVVGVDALPEAVQAVTDGKLTGTVLNDHFNQSHTAANVALELLAGKDVSAYYWVDYVKVINAEAAQLKEAQPKVETVEQAEQRYAERAKK